MYWRDSALHLFLTYHFRFKPIYHSSASRSFLLHLLFSTALSRWCFWASGGTSTVMYIAGIDVPRKTTHSIAQENHSSNELPKTDDHDHYSRIHQGLKTSPFRHANSLSAYSASVRVTPTGPYTPQRASRSRSHITYPQRRSPTRLGEK